jgi:hypothetical protein
MECEDIIIHILYDIHYFYLTQRDDFTYIFMSSCLET